MLCVAQNLDRKALHRRLRGDGTPGRRRVLEAQVGVCRAGEGPDQRADGQGRGRRDGLRGRVHALGGQRVHSSAVSFRRVVPVLCAILGCGAPGAGPREAGDILVFAPHPDDETLGCAGVLRQALVRGHRVRVAVFTNGDGFPAFASRIAGKPVDRLAPEDYLELARYRQNQSRAALRALGGKPEDLVFLGYPDSCLDEVYRARGPEPVQQRFTRKSETDGARPFTYASVLSDVIELIRTFKPDRIYVTNKADRHRDHQASFRFVRDAVKEAGYRGGVETYLIHGGPEWPWPPGITPRSPFEAHPVKGERIPLGVPWPPPVRVALSPEESRLKLAAIRAHATHLENAPEGPLARERDYLESFVKSEEVFWPADP